MYSYIYENLDPTLFIFLDDEYNILNSSSTKSCIIHDSKKLIKYFKGSNGSKLVEEEIKNLRKLPSSIKNINTVYCYNFSKKFIIYKYYDTVDLNAMNSKNREEIFDFIIAIIQDLLELHQRDFIHGDTSINNLKYDQDLDKYVFIDTETLKYVKNDSDYDNKKWMDIVNFIRSINLESKNLELTNIYNVTKIISEKSRRNSNK